MYYISVEIIYLFFNKFRDSYNPILFFYILVNGFPTYSVLRFSLSITLTPSPPLQQNKNVKCFSNTHHLLLQKNFQYIYICNFSPFSLRFFTSPFLFFFLCISFLLLPFTCVHCTAIKFVGPDIRVK